MTPETDTSTLSRNEVAELMVDHAERRGVPPRLQPLNDNLPGVLVVRGSKDDEFAGIATNKTSDHKRLATEGGVVSNWRTTRPPIEPHEYCTKVHKVCVSLTGRP